MINLELTEDEAYNLRTLLGMHSTDSAYDTFPVFEKLADVMDSDLSSREQLVLSVNNFERSLKVREKTEINEYGLIVIKERV